MTEEQNKEVMRLADEIADYAWREGVSDGAYTNAKDDRECRADSRTELEAYLRTILIASQASNTFPINPNGASKWAHLQKHDGAEAIGVVFRTGSGSVGSLVDGRVVWADWLAHPNGSKPEGVNAELLEALRTFESRPKPGAFRLGDLVKKVSGSAWEGRIVGTYSTDLTPEGYAVESASHPGSVQIYPAKALTLVIQEAGIQPTEGQHAQHVDVSGANVNATFRISKQTGADALVGLRGCNSRHGGRATDPCKFQARMSDAGCAGCEYRGEESQSAEAGG